MQTVKLGLAGFGTVGSGVAKVLADNKDLIRQRTGCDISIKTVVVRDLNKPRAYDPNQNGGPQVRFSKSLADLHQDPEIDIVLELMGGLDAAQALIKACLINGKHVVTANKALLAEKGQPLFALAAKNGLGLFYEAAIAGAIPIVQVLKDSLAANRVTRLVGILNGTANYILSEMTTNGLDFSTALEQAQKLGYAEADPTLDIEGVDAAHKLALLIRLAYGRHLPFDQLPVSGISSVDPLDIKLAYDFGYRLKLLGQVREVDGKIEAGMHPALVKYTFLLARVGGNYNAVRVETDAAGPIMLTGQGAGDTPTASAVLADVIALVRGLGRVVPNNTGYPGVDEPGVDEPGGDLPLAKPLDPDLAESEHYFRFTAVDKPGVMAAIAGVMADLGISIAQAVQQHAPEGSGEGDPVPIVFTTHSAAMGLVRQAIQRINNLDVIAQPTVHYRIF